MAKKNNKTNSNNNNNKSDKSLIDKNKPHNALTRRDEQKRQLREKLNSKQLCFCHNYILESSTAVEAYQTAYPRSNI